MLPTSRTEHCAHSIGKAPNVILFLAANPSGTSRLAFDEECAAIERELRMTDGRDDFDFRSKWAVTVDELMRHLNELQPAVIHFSGHGRDVDGECSDRTRQIVCDGNRQNSGLYLHDERGSPQCVTSDALKKM